MKTLHLTLSALCATALFSTVSVASDHGDTPLLNSFVCNATQLLNPNDPCHARNAKANQSEITDLFAFKREDKLVLVLNTNQDISASTTSYIFPTDVNYSIMIDTGICGEPTVTYDNIENNNKYGGTLVRPHHIAARKQFNITFDANNEMVINTKGISRAAKSRLKTFAGLADDPFIRAGRQNKNVAAIVLEIPLTDIVTNDDTLLIWGTTSSTLINGNFVDHAGRSLRSMFAENDLMNTKTPTDHFRKLHVTPDVMIYNTLEAASYPNGRELTDDVINLACLAGGNECRVFNQATEGLNGPLVNDVPYRIEFPYLAPAHLPVAN